MRDVIEPGTARLRLQKPVDILVGMTLRSRVENLLERSGEVFDQNMCRYLIWADAKSAGQRRTLPAHPQPASLQLH